MPLSPAAPQTAPLARTPEAFARLFDGFRGRVEGEIAGFLAAKRAAAGAASRDFPGTARAPLSDPADLVDGLSHLMVQGGKRLRPALVYYTYLACGGRRDEQAMPLALATEFLHTYLLIHDDIMDHAELRRGQPAAHARFRDLHRASGLRGASDDFGRSVAILLGDLAHTYAVELFTTALLGRARTAAAPAGGAAAAQPQRPQQPHDRRDPQAPGATEAPKDLRELAACFSQMCDEVIGGQYLEFLLAHGVAAAPRGGTQLEAELLRILRLKSGRYTAERPIQLGALLAGAAPAPRAELSRYGTAVGEAFQLQDDVLGLYGDPARVGKPVGDDLREGKYTFLVHHALVAGGTAERQIVAAALGKADLTAAELARVQQVVERTGARRAVAAMIAERLTAARAALSALAAIDAVDAPAAPRATPESRDGFVFLSGLLDYLGEREA
jgi:geranylgeranyl diphosphate synthase type I